MVDYTIIYKKVQLLMKIACINIMYWVFNFFIYYKNIITFKDLKMENHGNPLVSIGMMITIFFIIGFIINIIIKSIKK